MYNIREGKAGNGVNNEPKIGSVNLYNGRASGPNYMPKYRILIDYFDKYHNTIFVSGIRCEYSGKLRCYGAFDYDAIKIGAL